MNDLLEVVVLVEAETALALAFFLDAHLVEVVAAAEHDYLLLVEDEIATAVVAGVVVGGAALQT